MAHMITTGSAFGITAQQARVMRMMSEGVSKDMILRIEFKLDPSDKSPENVRKCKTAREKISNWMRSPKCQECYRAIIRESAMFGVGKANNVLIKTMDSENEWAAMQAAQGYLARYGDAVMGEESNETVIRIEGMPTLGTPNTAEEDS